MITALLVILAITYIVLKVVNTRARFEQKDAEKMQQEQAEQEATEEAEEEEDIRGNAADADAETSDNDAE